MSVLCGQTAACSCNLESTKQDRMGMESCLDKVLRYSRVSDRQKNDFKGEVHEMPSGRSMCIASVDPVPLEPSCRSLCLSITWPLTFKGGSPVWRFSALMINISLRCDLQLERQKEMSVCYCE